MGSYSEKFRSSGPFSAGVSLETDEALGDVWTRWLLGTHLQLPLLADATTARTTRMRQPRPKMSAQIDSSLHILAVDDDPSAVKALRRLLRAAGHTVKTAVSGAEALVLFKNEKFDLVITDYQMSGMNGDELAAAIKALVPIQPIMVLTAHEKRLKSSSGSLSPAVDVVIDKLAPAEELFKAIAKLLEKS